MEDEKPIDELIDELTEKYYKKIKRMIEERRRREDKKLIEEYMEKEAGNCVKFFKTMMEKAERGEESSFADFYPEWNLRERVPYTGYDFSIPLWVMLPYYNTVMVPILSHFSEQEFREKYGCGIEDLLKLEKEGKVVLRLAPLYGEGISDYLRPIFEEGLEKGRPTEFRVGLLTSLDEELREESIRLFKGRFPKGKWGLSAEGLESVSIERYSEFKFLGFNQVAEYIKRTVDLDPYLAFDIMEVYHDFLVGPKLFSLDGLYFIPREKIESLSSLPPGISSLKTGKYEIFPCDVGKVLVERAKLVYFDSLKGTLSVYNDFWKARDALKNLEEAVERKQYEKLIDRKEALEEAVKDLESIEVRKEAVKKIVEVSFDAVGVLADFYLEGFSGVLTEILIKLFRTPAVEFISSRTARIGKDRNIVAVYDFIERRKREEEEWSNLRVPGSSWSSP